VSHLASEQEKRSVQNRCRTTFRGKTTVPEGRMARGPDFCGARLCALGLVAAGNRTVAAFYERRGRRSRTGKLFEHAN